MIEQVLPALRDGPGAAGILIVMLADEDVMVVHEACMNVDVFMRLKVAEPMIGVLHE